MTSDLMRTCCRCGAEKPHALFSKDRRKPFGISYACRDCDAIRHKRYGSQPHVYQKMLERAKSAKPDPVKNKARKYMRDAVRRGKLMKPEICEDCGEKSAIIHGHHEDYSVPLSVNWLCPKCHKLRHRIKDGTAALAPAEQHPDDMAVDRFAAAMKAKLAKKRAEGRGGWERKDECSADFLSKLLRDHVEKGDPLDVGNLAMMLHQRDERIAPTHPGGDSRS